MKIKDKVGVIDDDDDDFHNMISELAIFIYFKMVKTVLCII